MAGTLQDVVDGGCLWDYRQATAPRLLGRRVVRIASQIANGLAYLHSQRIVHGRLNLHNILLQLQQPRLRRLEARLHSKVTLAHPGDAAAGLDCGVCVCKVAGFGCTWELHTATHGTQPII
jgi:serine/threonine protein kinase